MSEGHPKKLNLEVTSCENGYLVLEGNSLRRGSEFTQRKLWVAKDRTDLAEVIISIAAKGTENE